MIISNKLARKREATALRLERKALTKTKERIRVRLNQVLFSNKDGVAAESRKDAYLFPTLEAAIFARGIAQAVYKKASVIISYR